MHRQSAVHSVNLCTKSEVFHLQGGGGALWSEIPERGSLEFQTREALPLPVNEKLQIRVDQSLDQRVPPTSEKVRFGLDFRFGLTKVWTREPKKSEI